MNPAPRREALARADEPADPPADGSSEEEERALEELRGPRPLKRRRPPKGMRFYVDRERERSPGGQRLTGTGAPATRRQVAPSTSSRCSPSWNCASRENRARARPCFTAQVTTPSAPSESVAGIEPLLGAIAQPQAEAVGLGVDREHPVGGVLDLDEAPVAADLELELPALGGDDAAVEGLDDLRVIDPLAVVPPAQLAVELEAAVLAGVPALRVRGVHAGKPALRRAGRQGGQWRTHSVNPLKATAPQKFTSTARAPSARNRRLRVGQPESARRSTR